MHVKKVYMNRVPVSGRTVAQKAESFQVLWRMSFTSSGNHEGMRRNGDRSIVYRLYQLTDADIVLIEQKHRNGKWRDRR